MKTPPAQQVLDCAESFVDSIGGEMSEGCVVKEVQLRFQCMITGVCEHMMRFWQALQE